MEREGKCEGTCERERKRATAERARKDEKVAMTRGRVTEGRERKTEPDTRGYM